jgi:hypothetical protein
MAKAILSADGMITVMSLLLHLVLYRSPVSCQSLFPETEKKIKLQQPNIFKVFNHFSEGADRADENTDKYRASIRGKE